MNTGEVEEEGVFVVVEAGGLLGENDVFSGVCVELVAFAELLELELEDAV